MQDKLKTLQMRQNVHLARKIWHMAGVLAIVGVYVSVSQGLALKIIAVSCFVVVSLDLGRLAWPKLNFFLIKVFSQIMRESEKSRLAGMSSLYLGCLVIMFFLPKPVVILALLFLGLADPIASYVGIRYGQDRLIKGKSLQGTAAAFVVCLIVSTLYYYFNEIMVERLLIVSLLSGVIGALSELLPVGPFDDNFTLPVMSGFALWGVFWLFGGL